MSSQNEANTSTRDQFRFGRLVIVVLCLVVAAPFLAEWLGVFPGNRRAGSQNAILVIAPYRYQGTWVFDDPAAGLVREPFVAGIPEMIDHLVADIPSAQRGFRVLFSAQPFPGHQKKLTWLRADDAGTGNWYRLEDPPMEGWLCPSLFKYFAKAPPELYVKAEPIE
jgi:hypothetical protein